MKTILLTDIEATKTIAVQIAQQLRPGHVVTLRGDLGAGKTTLSRFIIQHFMPELEYIPSPTFNLVHVYDFAGPDGRNHQIWHFDLYRLRNAEEVIELGWFEATTNGIVLVEWPQILEHATGFLPDQVINITLEQQADGTGADLAGCATSAPPRKRLLTTNLQIEV